MKAIRPLLVGLGTLLICVGCSSVDAPEEETTQVKEEGDRIFIVDQTGMEWDITHAVRAYGMRPELFQFGLGPYAIRPIINPRMLSPGEGGYPTGDQTHIVIGTTIGGESRAYSIDDLNAHEIVDEVFGDVHVAVGW